MIVKESEFFTKWFEKLKDDDLADRISIYIYRLAGGNFSNCKAVGEGIHEIKINYKKGYRVYFTNIEGQIILLLCGGDKSTQQKDIQKAKQIKKLYE
ncbi:MAG: type II toxin-antitoxin system RelE/ParE family toxin [Elusimicrobia bacterium]|nr:type II toxin-antitoxin system RelE/ParE family toxin [Elusimicrobiota bacterium]MBR3628805.1 type II toxin-antitoxin system RelE/ParE family toxin [Elusimicrobiota bacterium]MCR4662299.1 type II toxin-antitoxin system RelE/ParE family toxin [Endomicrobiaceae bacterium]